MQERLGLSTIWDRIAAFLRSEAQLVIPIAAAFFFLPSVLLTRFMPAPTLGGGVSTATTIAMIAVLVIQTIGQLAILGLLLVPGRPTVRQALGLASNRALPALGAQILLAIVVVGIILVPQLILSIVGGVSGRSDLSGRMIMLGVMIASPVILYALARCAVVFPVMISEKVTRPIAALKRSMVLTAAHGWRIAALIAMITLLYLLVQVAAGAALGSVFMIVGLGSFGRLLLTLIVVGVGAFTNLFITLGLGFIYQNLAR